MEKTRPWRILKKVLYPAIFCVFGKEKLDGRIWGKDTLEDLFNGRHPLPPLHLLFHYLTSDSEHAWFPDPCTFCIRPSMESGSMTSYTWQKIMGILPVTDERWAPVSTAIFSSLINLVRSLWHGFWNILPERIGLMILDLTCRVLARNFAFIIQHRW